MMKSKRVTIYFEPGIHKALRLKSAETEQSVSALVNQAVRAVLSEDAEDLADLEARVSEPTVSYEEFVKDLKDRGRL